MLRPRLLCPLAMLLALVVPAGLAFACPVCDSDTGQQVRAGIMDGDLGLSLLAVVLPFAVMAGIVWLIHFGGRLPHGERSATYRIGNGEADHGD